MHKPRIAIACQGGGAHAAFTAGVLDRVLEPGFLGGRELVALSGTSGGAVCAAIAWSGLLRQGAAQARERLERFWTHDLPAAAPLDAALNDWAVFSARLPFSFRVSPYAYVPVARDTLERLLVEHVQLDHVPASVHARRNPYLRIGAADVLSGNAACFEGETLEIAHILASAAVPPLFRAEVVGGRPYWDGLYSQNPPVRELIKLPGAADRKPDEIWVVRLNPRARTALPKTSDEIEDRRNELAGNLPLDQELYLIGKINALLEEAPALRGRYRPIAVREIELDRGGDYASKLDRSPEALRALWERGRRLAPLFRSDASLRAL
jgi:NTE family protein